MVNIEIDGIPLKVDSSKMIIQAADEAGIDIPRFCYHKNLSIVANCRMCLVEVDNARKALPACATPVANGMKVFTQSEIALQAQRGVMEFLLINHPLDCPICDQGGECELQDLSLGYGSGISRFSEKKRVVKDKDIGPLVQTDMTRCIHCTRCVRFGQEIAGIKELGATGRGEHMEIGTYVEHSLASELSGNIIDLCPVGALTSKPFRYKARAWEMTSHPSIAMHDAVGSNLDLHTRQNEVMRVVARDNESVNQSWISDRDRFSYLGLKHPDRLLNPMIKQNGEWLTTDWQTAMEFAVEGLKHVKAKNGADQIAGLISPTATLEEGYLFQRWLRAFGSHNIDHRLRQQDFSDAGHDQFSAMSLADIENSDAIVLLGCNIRSEAPLLAHRVRQSACDGGLVSDINFFKTDLLMPVDRQVVVNSAQLLVLLSGIAKTLLQRDEKTAKSWQHLMREKAPSATEQNIAMQLANARQSVIIVGALANQHPQAAIIRSLAALISELTCTHLLILPEANSQALHLAGAVPHSDMIKDQVTGLNADEIWTEQLRAYVLFNVEPEFDCANPAAALLALQRAGFVVAINSFQCDSLRDYADVLLPLAAFTETSGTFVGLDHQWQSFTGAVAPPGESRPGWKILRVLGNISKFSGFDYVSSEGVRQELQDQLNRLSPTKKTIYIPTEITNVNGVQLISEVPVYRTDSLVRHSKALQLTPENQFLDMLRLPPLLAEKFGLQQGDLVQIQQDEFSVAATVLIDEQVAENMVHLAAASPLSARLGSSFGKVALSAMMESIDA
ncbi:NADH-quinone oxidoreductase subunit NuoG [Methylophaga sp.]|uniref:NADH-quinone oxidoreductase subunit NuoG n=1 Tax=Methylophaga sp. TaxID=2024840 RepID=UPI0027225DEA|nr:NADH-quinone oxidoreductase subunit NuoG [Methylophaga sp.]MDO8828006.1 NADH-quinone oxidoreductase subunit NuoG [Methylophaga sp.]